MAESSQISGRIERQSNFELLRIFAMLMIVAHHYAVHGMKFPHSGMGEGADSHRLFTFFLVPGGRICVALFFMLTGYFMIKTSIKPQKLVKLILQIFYYSFFALILFFVTYLLGLYKYPEYSSAEKIKFFIRTLIPVTSGEWWFVTAYVALYLLVPLLNSFLQKLNRKGVILCMFIAWIFWYTLPLLFGGVFGYLQKAIFFYSLGAFLRIHYQKRNHKALLIIFAVVSWLFYAAAEHFRSICTGTDIVSRIYRLVCDSMIIGVLVPLSATCIFLLFKNLSIPHNKIINTISATTFGIYLIHDSNIVRPLIWNGFFHPLVQYQSRLYPFYAMTSILAVFVACSVIELIRLKFIEPPILCFANTKYEQIKNHLTMDTKKA